MAYRALYRQWRPKDFSHMVGQKAIIDTLRNQVINERIAHAYLFCGSRGTGKTSTAKIMAKAINCENPNHGDPCGKCPNCLRMDNEESLDIIEIDAASNNGVDEMRDLRETVKYPPQFGKFKVYIIDEVHMLSTSAFNALLKTLEEPPAHIVFILATTEPQKLPETILSRCQRFDFRRISMPEICSRLKEASVSAGAEVSDGALMTIARAAEGGMRDALSILDMCLGYGNEIDEKMVRNILGSCDKSFLFRFGKALADQETETVFQMIDELMRNGQDPSVFAREISQHIRSLILAKECPDEIGSILDITEEDSREYLEQSDAYTVTRLMKILDIYMALETEMRFSSSPRLALENASLKCCIRTKETDQQALTDRIEELEKKIKKMESLIQQGHVIPSEESVSTAENKKKRQEKENDYSEMPKTVQPDSDNNSIWNELMKQYKKADPGTWSMLNHGNIIRNDQDIFIWQPASPEDDFFLISLGRDDKKLQIGKALSVIAGKECRFDTLRREEGNAGSNDPEKDYLNTLYQTFGREPVDIVE